MWWVESYPQDQYCTIRPATRSCKQYDFVGSATAVDVSTVLSAILVTLIIFIIMCVFFHLIALFVIIVTQIIYKKVYFISQK